MVGECGAKKKPAVAWETTAGFRGGEGRNLRHARLVIRVTSNDMGPNRRRPRIPHKSCVEIFNVELRRLVRKSSPLWGFTIVKRPIMAPSISKEPVSCLLVKAIEFIVLPNISVPPQKK